MSLTIEAPTLQHSALEWAKAHLGVLIGYDSVSSRSNRALIDYAAETLAKLGADITILPNEDGTKANMIARFGPADQPGIVLSGHTDVVPAEEDTWITPPFVADEREGRIYGRGSCDMKGFAACILAKAGVIAKADLKRPVYICFSYDEEVGCLGAPAIARWLAALDVPPELAIIGEPSEMKLITGQKGKIAMRAHVKGTSGHSSFAPDHVNAVEYATRIIATIAERADRYQLEGPFDADFTVPHATMLTTMIKGGVATNVTPDTCSFTFELRSISGMDAEGDMQALLEGIEADVVAKMKAKSPSSGVTWERIFAYPAMGEARGSAAFECYAHLMPEWGGKVSYGSEGGVFETEGNIPSVIVGPGSIKQAHRPNEFVEIDQLEQCLTFIDELTSALEQPV
ncbi:acetylornithine deacetylase [Cohaesibacter sp. CAU 1516]|uniref:acetylornithine deacetylase n=1 Tax=Cohaesibacter sp. CAU 1516 TaxID=2576038 RepID=UPI0010FDDA30|nr:acetylornithine deacetylase [Cohaesibacter sp. CAU 1516]TLP45934.1 acetylornithine deacetylase [Cohaesibacter sp. CAU 1516]